MKESSRESVVSADQAIASTCWSIDNKPIKKRRRRALGIDNNDKIVVIHDHQFRHCKLKTQWAFVVHGVTIGVQITKEV